MSDPLAPMHYPADMVFHLPNCGLVALSIVTATPLLEVTEWYRTTFKMRANWRGRTHHKDYAQWFQRKGIWTNHVTYPKDRVRTIGDFAEWNTKPGKFYMVLSSGHIMVAKDGWVADQWAIAHANRHPNRNRRVKMSWEIL